MDYMNFEQKWLESQIIRKNMDDDNDEDDDD